MQHRRRGTVLDLRRENRAVVLSSLYSSRPSSRQNLSAATGLSVTSVTNVVRDLLDEGIVAEVGWENSDGGRPRVLLDINPDYGYVIGVDIGETRIRIDLFDLAFARLLDVELNSFRTFFYQDGAKLVALACRAAVARGWPRGLPRPGAARVVLQGSALSLACRPVLRRRRPTGPRISPPPPPPGAGLPG